MRKNDLPQGAPILSIDFDGVLHSYVSGWKGPRNISDPPVPGAIDWLSSLVWDQRDPFAPRYKDFDVQIFSSRSRYWGGRGAMKKWLLEWGLRPGELEAIRFPLFKPPSYLHIDDRAIQFRGIYPMTSEMRTFVPWRWNRRLPPSAHVELSWLDPCAHILPGLEQQEVTYAKTQPQYNPLATLRSQLVLPRRLGEPRRSVPHRALSRWRPTVWQRELIASGKDIFLELMTFGHPLQPIRMYVADETNRAEILGLMVPEEAEHEPIGCGDGGDSGEQSNKG